MKRLQGFGKKMIEHYRKTYDRDPMSEFHDPRRGIEPGLARLAKQEIIKAAVAREIKKHMPIDPAHVSGSEKCGIFIIGLPVGIFTVLYFMKGR